ncbi:MAG: response regulator transcription factor [Gemmatimonadales bacterium]
MMMRGTTRVVVDLVMPVLKGLRTIRELKERFPLVRIIAISGESLERLDLAQDYGAKRSIVKPVEPARLLGATAGLLRRSTGRDDVSTLD